MTLYQLPDWLGGGTAHSTSTPDAHHRLRVIPWADGRPVGGEITISVFDLERLPDPGEPTPQEVLDCGMTDNESGATTVRGYLVALASAVWEQGEGFDGKRPFGDSGWHSDVYEALGAKGWIRYEADGGGMTMHVDRAAGNRLIRRALRLLAGEDDS